MQVIKYKWTTVGGRMEPFLFCFGDGGIKRIKLLRENISFSVGRKRCIGHFKDGKYLKCPSDRLIENGWNCNECKLNDDFFFCIKCDGSECINEKQRPNCKEGTYFVYLAAFDSVLKVGISHERRLLERLIEQGADFGAKIAVVKDGKDVRLVEQEIKEYLRIVDRVSGEQKQKLIFGNPNTAASNIFKALSALQGNGFSLIQPEIYDLRSYYELENVAYDPEILRIAENTKISGTVAAAKGNILILRNEGRFFSLNAHELMGRDITGELQ